MRTYLNPVGKGNLQNRHFPPGSGSLHAKQANKQASQLHLLNGQVGNRNMFNFLNENSGTVQRKEAAVSEPVTGSGTKKENENDNCPENNVRDCDDNLVPKLTAELEKAAEFVDNTITKIRVSDFQNTGDPALVNTFDKLFGTPDMVNVAALANNLNSVLKTLHKADLRQSIPEANPTVVCADNECYPRCKDSRAIHSSSLGSIILCDHYIKDNNDTGRLATLIHEATHAALFRKGIDVYSFTRLFKLLKELQAPLPDPDSFKTLFVFKTHKPQPLLPKPIKPVAKRRRDPAFNNPDTIATFVLIANGIGKGAAIHKGLAPKDKFFGSLQTKKDFRKNAELIVALTEQHVRSGKTNVERALIDVRKISETNSLWDDKSFRNKLTIWMLRDPGFVEISSIDDVESSSRCGPAPSRFQLGCPANGRKTRTNDLSVLENIDNQLGKLESVFKKEILIGSKNSKKPPLSWNKTGGKMLVGFHEDLLMFPPHLGDIQNSVEKFVEAMGFDEKYSGFLIDNFEYSYKDIIALI